jgi:hypothetical protein
LDCSFEDDEAEWLIGISRCHKTRWGRLDTSKSKANTLQKIGAMSWFPF